MPNKTTPSFEVSREKRSRRSGLDEVARKSLEVITVDSPERAFDASPTLEGVAQDAAKDACASLEDGALAEGLPNAD